MKDILYAVSNGLHLVAMVIFVGQCILLGLIYAPVFASELKGTDLADMLRRVEARMRPWFAVSLLTMIVTGAYLMLVNEHYSGFGSFFSNSWSIFMSLKHLVIVLMIAVAMYTDRVLTPGLERVLATEAGSVQQGAAVQRLKLGAGLTAALGVVVLLLTAAAQAA